MSYLPRHVLAAIEDTIAELDFKKANASTLGGLTTRVNSVETLAQGKADAGAVAAVSADVAKKADATIVTALAAAMPVIADETPQPEKTGGAAGVEGNKASGARHQHPRLTSTTGNTAAAPTSHTIGANGTATIAFTRIFTTPPGIVFMEVPPLSGAMSTFPATFRVESWVREG